MTFVFFSFGTDNSTRPRLNSVSPLYVGVPNVAFGAIGSKCGVFGQRHPPSRLGRKKTILPSFEEALRCLDQRNPDHTVEAYRFGQGRRIDVKYRPGKKDCEPATGGPIASLGA
jgi:hypothetical protein